MFSGANCDSVTPKEWEHQTNIITNITGMGTKTYIYINSVYVKGNFIGSSEQNERHRKA